MGPPQALPALPKHSCHLQKDALLFSVVGRSFEIPNGKRSFFVRTRLPIIAACFSFIGRSASQSNQARQRSKKATRSPSSSLFCAASCETISESVEQGHSIFVFSSKLNSDSAFSVNLLISLFTFYFLLHLKKR